MKGFIASDISADLSMLMDGFSTDKRIVPSATISLKLSAVIPVASLIMSFTSALIVYFAGYNPELTLQAFIDYFLNDGWVFVAPTLIVGILFTLMSYNNLIVYLAIPESIRRRSVVMTHLRKVTKRTIGFFLILMLVATFLSGYSTWFAFSITGLLFSLLFIVNIIVGSEINRLGAGLAIEKISKLVKKI
ncbi:hypothetical protein [Rahnella aceris]|uniref:Uncharacterized protein n=1 Tax=Rahnella sp. (strain Y9602) TaxID=2703885 RepID=A0ABW6CGT0_RAHSY